jgi:putative FmdB family regulatory protein
MPTYVYRCQSCGTRFEAWQKMTDDPLTTCQTCGGPVRRVLYPAGIVFKGGGFYSTDNRSGSASSAPEGGTSASSDKPAEAAPAETKSAASTKSE